MNELNEKSASVQTHLQILQSTIQRMSSNSSQCKTWSVTLVSAILVIVSGKENSELIWIALLPSFIFLVLDAYYLGMEKGFVKSYNQFVKKLHNNSLFPDDLFFVKTNGVRCENEIEALKSFSIWGFYSGLILLIIIAKLYF